MTKIYNVLLIDDDKDYCDTLIDEAGFFEIKISDFRNLNEGLKSIQDKEISYDAIILDAKCLIDQEQETENEDFLPVALQRIQEIEIQSKKYYPLVVNTGFISKFDMFERVLSERFSKIFSKTENSNMFDFILEKIKQSPKIQLERLIKSIPNLIEDGEDKNIEFKSTLMYCVEKNQKEPYIEHSIAKTIAAFANSEGGILFIGVSDKKEILGLDNDINLSKPKTLDGFILSLDNLVENYLKGASQVLINNIKYTIENKNIIILEINKSNHPIFVIKNKKNESVSDFFIRAQASTRNLNNQEFFNYIKNKKEYWVKT